MGVQLPVFSILSIFLLVLILPAQVHHYSIPSLSVIVWLIFCNLIHGINSVLWFGNQAEHAPVWCDICKVAVRAKNNMLTLSTASVVLLGAMVALPGCFLCISRRLEAITSLRGVEKGRNKMYEAAFEAATCVLLPALYMGLRASH
jgi:hypothetical protein